MSTGFGNLRNKCGLRTHRVKSRRVVFLPGLEDGIAGHLTKIIAVMSLTLACGEPTSDDTDITEPKSTTVRVMTWNVEGVGSTASDQYAATRSIISRLDPHVIAFNEVDEFDIGSLNSLASELGYSHVFVPNDNPFGSIRNAIISKYPFERQTALSGAELSGDSRANDVTRYPLEVEVDLPDVESSLVVVSQHWKSGGYTQDAFRRVVDGERTAQVGGRWRVTDDWVLVMGDVNAELDEVPGSPSRFEYQPTNLPSSYRLGADLKEVLDTEGLANNPFSPLVDLGYRIVDVVQADGRDATRPTSDRRLDYVFASDLVISAGFVAEVYDSKDEHLSDFPKVGEAPERGASDLASDHLPVVLEFTVTD